MKKVYIIIGFIILCIVAISIILFSNKNKTINQSVDNIIPQSNLIVNDSKLIKEDKTVDKITFKNCKIVAVDGKTMVKIELLNNTSELFSSNMVTFQLLDENNTILAQETKENIFIQKEGKILLNVNFDKAYDNVYDIKYIIEK